MSSGRSVANKLMTSCLVDINVWLALSHKGHVHHALAIDWFSTLENSACFCRPTQIGFLRLLTNSHVMGKDAQTLRQAWTTYDALREDDRVDFLREPPGVEEIFRELTQSRSSRAAGLRVVSFDSVFNSMRGVDSVVLGGK